MPLPGGPFNISPDPRDAVWHEIRMLKDRITRVETARRLENATISKGGLTIKDGGSITLIDADGVIIGKFGSFENGIGVALYRPDGTLALQVFSGFVGVYDRSGNYVVTDDTTSGQGVARPYIPFGAFADNSVPTQTTTSSAFVTVQTLIGYKQHPKITAQILCRSSAADTAGQARLVDQSGTQVGDTIAIAAGEFTYHTIDPAPLAGAHLAPISLNLQIRRTAGTGTVGARGVSAWGVESAPV